jgi:Relaxase/Mobilisation nuclease domain
VVIKGTSCAGARRLALHLSCTESNERNELREVRDVVAEDLYGALREMEAVAIGTRCGKPFYHASINTPAHERLTDEQRFHAIDRLEAALGLSGQPRVVVIHHKKGREHCHVVWSRIDLERLRAIGDSHNFAKHEQVARDLERAFGHARVQGAHAEREGRPRPERTPSHAEMLQAERTGLSVQTVKATVTDIWRRNDTSRAFASALRDAGYLLARGDRRDFVVVDPEGGVHSLARRVEGLKVKDIRARMADLDAAQLPSVMEARRLQRDRSGGEPTAVRRASPRGRRWIPSPRLPAALKRLARDTSHQLGIGFAGHEGRYGNAGSGTRQASPIRHRHIGHFIRPPGFYARLKHDSKPGEALGFASDPAVGKASLYVAARAVGTSEPAELPRPAWSSPQPAVGREDLRATEIGASSPDNFDGENVELGQILSAIAEDVHRHCAAACQGIEAQFAARRASARKTLPKHQIAGALAAISAERRALLAAVRQQAKTDLFGRAQTAKARYRRQRSRPAARQEARSADRLRP